MYSPAGKKARYPQTRLGGKKTLVFHSLCHGRKEWGKGVGINATLTLLIPDSILEILGTWTLVQSPWLDSVSKAEITA